MLRLVRDFRPRVVVVDPISNMLAAGTADEAQAMLLRLVDSLKHQQITALFTNLTSAGDASLEQTDLGISSIVDTWILLRDIELGGERNRGMYVLKSRGMAHSNQIREFLLTDRGIELRDVYVGPEGVLTGSMRLAQEARERAAAIDREREEEAAGAGSWSGGAPRSRPSSRRCGASSRRSRKRPPGRPRRPACSRSGASATGPRWREVARPTRATGYATKVRHPEARPMQNASDRAGPPAADPPEPDEVVELRLYVAGQTPKSVAALANLKRVCEEHLPGRHTIEVIDLLQQPARARADQIVAIPTLVRRVPEPVRKVIGTLADTERVLVGLRIEPRQRPHRVADVAGLRRPTRTERAAGAAGGRRGPGAQVAELRRRLEEAEETIRAIREDEVDAFVVSRGEADRVLTLESADRPYRGYVEAMRQAAVTLSRRRHHPLREPRLRAAGDAAPGVRRRRPDRPVHGLLQPPGPQRGHRPPPRRPRRGAAGAERRRRGAGAPDGERLDGGAGRRLPGHHRPHRPEAAGRGDGGGTAVALDPGADGRRHRRRRPLGHADPRRGRRAAALRHGPDRPRLRRGLPAPPVPRPGGPDDPTAGAALDRPGASPGETIRGAEVRLERGDGQDFHLLLGSGPITDAGGSVIGFVATLTNITELRRVEDELREADRRKDEFLAMLAHELRNPLSAIVNAVQVARHSPDDGEARSWSAEVIERQARQLGHLVDDLLDVSRISRGKFQLRKELIDARHGHRACRPGGPAAGGREGPGAAPLRPRRRRWRSRSTRPGSSRS